MYQDQYITDEDVWEAENPGMRDRTRFSSAVLGDGLPDDLWANFWHLRGRHSDWIQTPAQAEASATRYGRSDVYIGPGLASKRGGSDERLSNETAAGMFGVVADLDIFWEGNPKTTLPPNLRTALAFIDSLALAPTFTIDSGHGLHLWWLFPQPWRFGEGEHDLGARLGYQWQGYVNEEAAEHGWKFDSVGDLARLLRLPGTENAKTKDIRPVFIERETDARYTRQLAEVCRDIVLPARVAHTVAQTDSETDTGDLTPTQLARLARKGPSLVDRAVARARYDQDGGRNNTGYWLNRQLRSLRLPDEIVWNYMLQYQRTVEHD